MSDVNLDVSNMPLAAVGSPRASRDIETRESLERWRCERLRAAEMAHDVMPPGLYQRIMDDTPERMAERMRRAAE